MNTQHGDDAPADGLLLTRDLFFGSKVTGTARELGFRVAMVGDAEEALRLAAQDGVRCVLIDLTFPELPVGEFVSRLSAGTGRPKVVAYGPHVQEARLEEARLAGCDDVLPRSRFSAGLAALLRDSLSP